jgi:hypothetical protein
VGNGGGAALVVSLLLSMMQGAVAEGNSDLNEYKITVVPLVMLSSDHKGGKCSNMAVRKVGDIQYVSDNMSPERRQYTVPQSFRLWC